MPTEYRQRLQSLLQKTAILESELTSTLRNYNDVEKPIFKGRDALNFDTRIDTADYRDMQFRLQRQIEETMNQKRELLSLQSKPSCSDDVGDSTKTTIQTLKDQVHLGFLRRNPLCVKVVFDRHCDMNSAAITAGRLNSAFAELGLDIGTERTNELLEEFDSDLSGGGLNLEGFQHLLSKSTRLNEWAKGLPLYDLLADAIPRKRGQDPLRVVSELSFEEILMTCQALQEGLIRVLQEASAALKQAFMETDSRAKSDGGSKFNVVALSCGGIHDFHAGVEERIGLPDLRDIFKAMEAEHCNSFDSDIEFTTSNYKVTTRPRTEWMIVLNNDESQADMRQGRRLLKIDEIMRRTEVIAWKVSKEEIIAVVLYTGPMFQIYNLVLRRFPKEGFDALKSGNNLYTTTIYALISCVICIARETRLASGMKLYRGLGGDKTFPPFFFKGDSSGRRGMLEWGFMSTTADKAVAIHYCGIREGKPFPTIFEIDSGAVDRGADITDLSQYPGMHLVFTLSIRILTFFAAVLRAGEKECLFPPCAFLEPRAGEALEVTPAGIVGKVKVRLNINLKAATIKELLSRRRTMHLSAFEYANAETARALQHIATEIRAEERLQGDPWRTGVDLQEWLQAGGKEEDLVGCVVAGGKITFTVEALLAYLRRGCESVLNRHAAAAAERFAADGAYRAMATEKIAAGAAAESGLRLYLEDTGWDMENVMRTSPMGLHRAYLGFLERTLPTTGREREVAAVLLCLALGAMEAFPHEVDADGLTPLMRAAADGAGARVLRSLAAARADLEARDQGFKATALWWAARCGHADAAIELARLGAEVNTTRQDGVSNDAPIYMASSRGFVDVVEALGRLGADVNYAVLDGRTPVKAAACCGHTSVVEALGRLGADLNQPDKDGWTPSHSAAQQGHTAVIEVLGQLGADVDRVDNSGYTPVHAAIQNGHTAVVKALGRLGADVNRADKEGWTPVHAAAQNGNTMLLEALSELSADVNQQDNDGCTPLHAAAQKGHIAAVEVLVRMQANMHLADFKGWAPIHAAAQNGHAAVVEALGRLEVDVNVADIDGWTPIHAAAQKGHIEVVAKLGQLGADVNRADNNGWTPGHVAAQKGYSDILESLGQLGADINRADNDGWTLVHTAAQNGHPTALELLGRLGADLNCTSNGWTPLAVAHNEGHQEAAAVLERLGAVMTVAKKEVCGKEEL